MANLRQHSRATKQADVRGLVREGHQCTIPIYRKVPERFYFHEMEYCTRYQTGLRPRVRLTRLSRLHQIIPSRECENNASWNGTTRADQDVPWAKFKGRSADLSSDVSPTWSTRCCRLRFLSVPTSSKPTSPPRCCHDSGSPRRATTSTTTCQTPSTASRPSTPRGSGARWRRW